MIVAAALVKDESYSLVLTQQDRQLAGVCYRFCRGHGLPLVATRAGCTVCQSCRVCQDHARAVAIIVSAGSTILAVEIFLYAVAAGVGNFVMILDAHC